MVNKTRTAKEATLKIGNSGFEHFGKAITEFANAIKAIFESGQKNGMEQETIRTAITAFSELASIKNSMVSGSTFQGDKTLNVNMDDMDKEELAH